jgi:hypothetical protein
LILHVVKQENAVAPVFDRTGEQFQHGTVHAQRYIQNTKPLADFGYIRKKINTEHKNRPICQNQFSQYTDSGFGADGFLADFRGILNNSNIACLKRFYYIRLADAAVTVDYNFHGFTHFCR